MTGFVSQVRLSQLKARHRIVAADLAAIVARADERRATTVLLRAETETLLAELRRQCERSRALESELAARRTPGTRKRQLAA